MSRLIQPFQSQGNGEVDLSRFAAIGPAVVFEPGVLVFHPESIHLGSNSYIGRQTTLYGYVRKVLSVGNDCWIGPRRDGPGPLQ